MNETDKLVDTKLKDFPYLDIIDLPHHESKKRDHMSLEARAAQFMPFAALTGFENLVEETARITDSKRELSEDQQNKINEILAKCIRIQDEKPLIEVTYYVADELKSGGTYFTTCGKLHCVETQNRKLVLENGKNILIDSIYNIRII